MKHSLLFLTFLIIITIILSGCDGGDNPTGNSGTDDPPGSDTETVTDFEGNVYATVQIGDQIWMAENLKSRYASDGTPLTGVYAYNNDESYVAEYGRLYTWETALIAAPSGWHLPSEEEWDNLEATLGNEPANDLRIGGASGFNAKLGGYRTYEGWYAHIDMWGMFWTSTVYTDDHSYTRTILHDRTDISHTGYGIIGAISVRCIKN
ncbi:FISUMP domain-containing protein [Bacteroidota bacterium]